MTNPYIQQYAEQEGLSYAQASREMVNDAVTSVPRHLQERYATIEEYQDAIRDFLNGQ